MWNDQRVCVRQSTRNLLPNLNDEMPRSYSPRVCAFPLKVVSPAPFSDVPGWPPIPRLPRKDPFCPDACPMGPAALVPLYTAGPCPPDVPSCPKLRIHAGPYIHKDVCTALYFLSSCCKCQGSAVRLRKHSLLLQSSRISPVSCADRGSQERIFFHGQPATD